MKSNKLNLPDRKTSYLLAVGGIVGPSGRDNLQNRTSPQQQGLLKGQETICSGRDVVEYANKTNA
jgi:hypothetical protein